MPRLFGSSARWPGAAGRYREHSASVGAVIQLAVLSGSTTYQWRRVGHTTEHSFQSTPTVESNEVEYGQEGTKEAQQHRISAQVGGNSHWLTANC